MVILSLACVLASSAMLAAGILIGSDLLVASSILLSVVSALVLVFAIRRQRPAETETFGSGSSAAGTPVYPRRDDDQLTAFLSTTARRDAPQESRATRGNSPRSAEPRSPGQSVAEQPRQNFAAEPPISPVGSVQPAADPLQPRLAPAAETALMSPILAHRERNAADDETVMLPTLQSVRRPDPDLSATSVIAQVESAADQATVMLPSGQRPPTRQSRDDNGDSSDAKAFNSTADSQPGVESAAEPDRALSEQVTELVRRPTQVEPSSPPAVPVGQEPADTRAPDAGQTESTTGDDATSPESEAEYDDDFDDPPDEPPAELLLSSEERRVATMSADVFVVDGRPRYHVTGCSHLADKASQALPVSEAAELGFTPCSACGAATTLLQR